MMDKQRLDHLRRIAKRTGVVDVTVVDELIDEIDRLNLVVNLLKDCKNCKHWHADIDCVKAEDCDNSLSNWEAT